MTTTEIMNEFEQQLELIPDHERMVTNCIFLHKCIETIQLMGILITKAFIFTLVDVAVWYEIGLDKQQTVLLFWCLYARSDQLTGVWYFVATHLFLLSELHTCGEYYLFKYAVFINLSCLPIAWVLFCYYNYPLANLCLDHGIWPTDYAKTRR